jgi:hypothetical protein
MAALSNGFTLLAFRRIPTSGGFAMNLIELLRLWQPLELRVVVVPVIPGRREHSWTEPPLISLRPALV